MKILSLELLDAALREEKEAEVVTETPAGFEEKLFNNFLRVMGATSLDEIADITDDELVRILEHGEELFKVMNLGDLTYSRIFERLACCHSAASIKRRVL